MSRHTCTFWRPAPRADPLLLSGLKAGDGELPLHFEAGVDLDAGSKAREAVGDALETAAPEDSDVFVVLHGLGGEAGELGMGSFNLEEVLANGAELES